MCNVCHRRGGLREELCVMCDTDAVDYVKSVLDSIRSNVGRDDIDDMVRQAEGMLREIRSRDFTAVNSSVQDELQEAVDGQSSHSG